MSSMSYIRALLATACPSRRSAFARDGNHDALRIRIFDGESFGHASFWNRPHQRSV